MTNSTLARLGRRGLLLAFTSAALLAGCGQTPQRPAEATDAQPPIVFVHGNGDTAALWSTTVWRFQSNGWPRNRLHAIDLPYPLARDDDAVAQPGRTSTTDHMRFLAAEVDQVLRATGARQVVLVANSRGGNAIRNYIENGGGASKVSHAILGGTPNHGVWAIPGFRPGSEFNGSGAFLTGLNKPKGANGDEVTPGVRWMTLRSDQNDKFAQPDGVWIGAKGTPTNVTFEGPALKGAENVVIPNADHREVSYGPESFAHAYRFITGRTPLTTQVTPETRVVLVGKVSGLGLDNDPAKGRYANNLPLAGATVEVYATDAGTGARQGGALHRRVTGADGRWGPLTTAPATPLEFVVSAPGYATTHFYRSPFPRSSDLVHLRATTLAPTDRDAKAIVVFDRPRGYFGVPRDQVTLDGKSPPAGLPPGVAGVSTSRLPILDEAGRTVVGEFNGERIAARAWPLAENRLVVIELHR